MFERACKSDDVVGVVVSVSETEQIFHHESLWFTNNVISVDELKINSEFRNVENEELNNSLLEEIAD
mgnify:CR=1 FL=1